MAAQYKDTITTRSGSVIPGAVVRALNSLGAFVTIYTDEALTQPVTQVVANDNGFALFYVPDGTYTIRISSGSVSFDIANVELYDLSTIAGATSGIASGKANASAIGVAGTATNLGTFTGAIIPDNQTAKQALQALETALAELPSGLNTEWSFVAELGQTEFNIGVEIEITPYVYRNGQLLPVDAYSYAGEIITLVNPCYEDDIVSIVAGVQFPQATVSASNVLGLDGDIGASYVGYKRSAVGAVRNNLLQRLSAQQSVPIDFGMFGDWVAGDAVNDAPALQAMIDDAHVYRRGVMPLDDGIFYINSALIVREDCGLDGGLSAGEPSGRAYGLRRSTLVIGPSGSVRVDRGGALRHINIIALDATTPPTSTADALARIAAWTGTGCLINGADVLLDRLTVVGFDSAITSDNNERPTLISPRIDCKNGIAISRCYDTGRVHDAQIWPFWSTHIDGLSNTVLVRSGTGINLFDTADGFLVSQPLIYGYKAGINLFDVYGCKVADFWIDNVIALQATEQASGIRTEGSVVNCGLSNGHVDSCDTNYNFGHDEDPGLMVVGCTGGQFRTRQVFTGAGGGGQIVGFQSVGGIAGSAAEIYAADGTGAWDVVAWKTRNSLATNFYQQAGASGLRFSTRPLIVNGPAFDGSVATFIPNGVPVGTPAGGGLLFVDAGALKYKGSGGTITTLGAA